MDFHWRQTLSDGHDEFSWAYALAEENLRTLLPRRWDHVKGVASRTRGLSSLFVEDAVLLECAAILHDIGYSPNVTVTGFHPLDGARYLRDRGASQRLCALVAHHSCAYREAELRGLSGELSEWIDEETPVRDALWWADMTTTPDGGVTNVEDRIIEIKRRYGSEDLVSFFIRQAKADLISAVERTQRRLRAAGLDHVAK